MSLRHDAGPESEKMKGHVSTPRICNVSQTVKHVKTELTTTTKIKVTDSKCRRDAWRTAERSTTKAGDTHEPLLQPIATIGPDFPTFPETYHPHPADRTPWVSDSDSQSEYMTNNDNDLLQPRRFILDSGVQTGQVSVPFFP